MDIQQRREKILKKVVEEYIKTAIPISSELLQSEWFFDISPATIRIDLAELTHEGFLEKPYVSGGRVPTDKGYRFFVDKLPKSQNNPKETNKFNQAFSGFQEIAKLSQETAKMLAKYSDNLGIVYLKDFDILYQEGWNNLFGEPEFADIGYIKSFSESIEELADKIMGLNELEINGANVFIGEECPTKKNDFSFVYGKAKYGAGDLHEICFAITGPKRMNFAKNIKLINELISAFNNYGG